MLFLFSLSITYYLYYFIISLLNHCIISINANIQRICDSFSDMQEKIHLLVEIMFENQACSSNVLTRFYSNYILKFIEHSWLLPTFNYKPRILSAKIQEFHFLVHKLLFVFLNMRLELRNKGSTLQLAPKSTHTRRMNIMGLKAPNMRVQ